MRRSVTAVALICAVGLAVAPASAAIVGATNIDISGQPFTFNFEGSNFTFAYKPSGGFDASPDTIQTSGAGGVSAFGGFLGIPVEPSEFFTSPDVVIGPDTFTQFASFTNPTAIPFSGSAGDLGLRVTAGADNYYGYARFAGSGIESIAFQTNANQSITAGSLSPPSAVPEPASWALVISGIGMAGGAFRRRRNVTVSKMAFR